MPSRLTTPDLGQIKNGDCNDPRIQESHIGAMLALARWADAATERINAAPEWQQSLCRKVDELKSLIRDQVAVRESQKEDILTIKIQLGHVVEWQRTHDQRQVRREDTTRGMVWDVVRPGITAFLGGVLLLAVAYLLGLVRVGS